MRPLSEYSSSGTAVRYVFTDIDDTMTNDGYLRDEAYAALWTLKRNGIVPIPVTGRPAGWCDLIIRQWPVAAVVGENGAFVYYREDDGSISTYTHSSLQGERNGSSLEEIRDAVLRRVPGSRVAKDQFCRLYDLAIDFREDPPDLGIEAAKTIKSIAEEYGAVAKISSIHVNIWFGSYDKLSMVREFMRFRYGVNDDELRLAAAFSGDSPNDEPMFGFFPFSFGVGNLKDFSKLMKDLPHWIADGTGGLGFSQIVSALCRGGEHG